MNYIMSVQLLPHHPEAKDLYSHVGGAIEIIEESGLTHFVGPMETTVEGSIDELMNLIKKLNNHLANEGCDKVISNIKLIQSTEAIRIKDILGDYYEFDDEE
ncbi:thiamine-binding protein [Salinicoccus sp. ID82-1]|uniref:Thiamine-binding protein n=1 Tax=Salinicoccus cyprini TaxID=2493691 RepID=A0A558ATV6_9STAP|nr:MULTISPECIES: thiamine-binding protein [Salinicoccus]MCG1010820.1 thiamine-binding protein [Salinicoccus sp. ID82-1]TVT27698.1 thiamine-binding protein [Salinicoccus cyprini]